MGLGIVEGVHALRLQCSKDVLLIFRTEAKAIFCVRLQGKLEF